MTFFNIYMYIVLCIFLFGFDYFSLFVIDVSHFKDFRFNF